MGNTLQLDKITPLITELAESTDLNEKFLITQLNALILLTGGNNTSYESIHQLFKSISGNMTDEHLINFSNNIISFINIQSKDNTQILQPSLIFLLCIIEIIYLKYTSFKSIFALSIQHNKEEGMNSLLNFYPFNVLSLCITIINSDDLFSRPSVDKAKFELLYYSIKLIYLIIGYPINVGKGNNNSIEDINMFKFVFHYEGFIQKETFEHFYKNLFSIFLNFFDSLLQYDSGVKMSMKEQLISMLFNVIMFFCWDVNQFFFDATTPASLNKDNHNDENQYKKYICCFENDYNQIVYDFIDKLYNSNHDTTDISFPDIIIHYQRFYQEELINLLHYNSKLLLEFMILLFNHYDHLQPIFKQYSCLFLSYVFESAPNFLEILSIREYLLVLLDNIGYTNLEEIALINKIVVSKTFVLLIKQIQDEEDNDSLAIVNNVLFKCLDVILNDKCPNCLILYLMMIVYNITVYLENVNKRVFIDFSKCFRKVLVVGDRNINMIEKCIIMKLFIEISFNFINSTDITSSFILSFIKIEDDMTNVYEETISKYNSSPSFHYKDNNKAKLIIKDTEKLFKSLKAIIEKVNSKIKQEGGDAKFSQDTVVSL